MLLLEALQAHMGHERMMQILVNCILESPKAEAYERHAC